MGFFLVQVNQICLCAGGGGVLCTQLGLAVLRCFISDYQVGETYTYQDAYIVIYNLICTYIYHLVDIYSTVYVIVCET